MIYKFSTIVITDYNYYFSELLGANYTQYSKILPIKLIKEDK